jgi:hypothetical protein
MTPSRYCLLLGASAAVIAGAIAAFNYAVDPYLLFGGKRIAGFNDVKPSVTTRERMMKAYQAGRVPARTIVMGSSRSDIGIDPATPAWPASARPVYNLSLVGSDTGDGVKYLRHYLALHPGAAPQTVIVGLDFEYFLYVPKPAAPVAAPRIGELEERLAVGVDGKPNPERTWRVLKDKGLGLLSLDALIDSAMTVKGNRSASAANLEANGHLSEAAMRDTARADGFALLFAQKNQDTVKQYGSPHRVISDTPDGPIRDFAAIRDLLALARAHNIDVALVIQPAHVSRLDLLDRMGYWNDYERWKRELTTLTAQASASQKVALWDFGGYERQAQETVPEKGAGAGDMQWFWDPVHYTTKLGDQIVARIFGAAPDGFGVRLTPANVDEQLVKVRQDRNAARAAVPDERARLPRLVAQ